MLALVTLAVIFCHQISYHEIIMHQNVHLVWGLVVSSRAWCTVVAGLLVHLVHDNFALSYDRGHDENDDHDHDMT